MKLRIVSDLHFETQADFGAEIARLVCGGPAYDALVVAGDLCSAPRLQRALEVLAAKSKAPILYVPGNHDFWNGRIEADGRMAASFRVKGVTILQSGITEIEGQRFLGTTLWFRRPRHQDLESLDRHWCDFNKIDKATFMQYGTARLYAAGLMSRAFLERELKAGDVVITHHLPHWNSVQPQFAGHESNRYYVHDVGDLFEREARLWIHGHTHASADYVVNKTRVICNAHGYPVRAGVENSRFDPHLTVDLS